MVSRILAAVFVAGGLTFSSGCCCTDGLLCCSQGCRPGYATPVVDHGYADCGGCGHADCGQCGHGDCGGCGHCDDCGHGGYGGCGPWGHCDPLAQLFNSLLGWGCGGTYWSDYKSDPPGCCEPCDHYGNWTGGHGPYSGHGYGPYGPHDSGYESLTYGPYGPPQPTMAAPEEVRPTPSQPRRPQTWQPRTASTPKYAPNGRYRK